MKFSELNISKQIKDALEHIEIISPTPIQEEAIPLLLEGKDIIGQAQTGTGKTFAFGIPLIEKIDTRNNSIQGLIVCPTRELTIQVYEEILKLVKFNRDVRVTAIYGGESYQRQFRELKRGPHIIVATPGRTIDHMERGTIDFTNLQMVVLDEADEMLKMGFQEDLEKILKDTPKERQTALFSATIPPFIKRVAKNYLNSPIHIMIDSDTLTVDKIDQIYYEVKKKDRNHLMIRLLDFYEPKSAMVFANTKAEVDALTTFLQKSNYKAIGLHGDLKQRERDSVMNAFKEERYNILVATDVAARGIDIYNIDYVFNYELPFEDEIYVHRIGRTGRAGKKGVSISIVYPTTRGRLFQIEKLINDKLTKKTIPTIEEIEAKNNAKWQRRLSRVIEKNEVDHYEELLYFHDKGYDTYDIINALLAQIKPKSKVYNDIEEVKRRDQQSQKQERRNRGKRQSRTQFKTFKINLGKNDQLRPVSFVTYIEKQTKIYARNVGDITINNRDTIFQIESSNTNRVMNLNNKFYKGKKVKVFEVK